jgi:2,3-bisphosphoglycerate-dependent phosphoglycerate mutase
MSKIVLLRHGQSLWNQQKLFTGWTDVDLSELGQEEARIAGQKLKAAGLVFDLGFTSCLKRTKLTMELVLQEMGVDIPWRADWRLNERHYGNLQGLNKEQMAEQFGAEQVKLWRRSYDVRPPEIAEDNQYNQKNDPQYEGIVVPSAESLADVVVRVVPFWQEVVVPLLENNQRIIIVASGNSLRALIKYLDQVSPKEIVDLEIPTGQPLIYELDDQFQPIKHYYL